jgi:SprT protein
MKTIEPISPFQQQQVVAETERYISIASDFFQRPFAAIPIAFDLKGRAAGMYKVDRGTRLLRFNPYLFAKYFQDNLANTVPHEVAHYISDVLHGLRHIRPHGKEWQAIMHVLGAMPERTHNFNMQGIPTRQQQRFNYRCQCQVYQLTTRRHNMIQKGQRRYLCRYCHGELNLSANCDQPAR